MGAFFLSKLVVLDKRNICFPFGRGQAELHPDQVLATDLLKSVIGATEVMEGLKEDTSMAADQNN